jgi:ATP/maltotriose-dependent transcriptional regulator MalT
MERFAYIEASVQFERALAESQTVEDEVRLCEKIGHAIFYSARPDLATPWFERALERCQRSDVLRPRVPDILMHLPRQYWLASRTEDALACAERAKMLATSNALVRRANTLAANYFVLLGRYDEAAIRSSVEQEPGEEDFYARTLYLNQRAIVHATQGRGADAFTNFDRAVEASKELPDGYMATVTWDDYANWAMALGRLDVARACRERALLVARERRIAWRIPYLTLRFASMLVTAGDYAHAQDLVTDAMTYDTATPVLRVLKATVGVELARTMNDESLLKRALDEKALEDAFRSGEPQRIGPIVAAYTNVAVIHRHMRRAKTLITRALAHVHQADHVGDLLSLAARYGSKADAARAYDLLQERIRLPNHRVARAYLVLWEAQTAFRRRSPTEGRQHAERAARAFGRLGWKHQQREALGFAGISQERLAASGSILSDLTSTLTRREAQIAELVLRGLTNHAISEILSISEHTVESHMTSILNRLGLRSRWQLMDISR